MPATIIFVATLISLVLQVRICGQEPNNQDVRFNQSIFVDGFDDNMSSRNFQGDYSISNGTLRLESNASLSENVESGWRSSLLVELAPVAADTTTISFVIQFDYAGKEPCEIAVRQLMKDSEINCQIELRDPKGKLIKSSVFERSNFGLQWQVRYNYGVYTVELDGDKEFEAFIERGRSTPSRLELKANSTLNLDSWSASTDSTTIPAISRDKVEDLKKSDLETLRCQQLLQAGNYQGSLDCALELLKSRENLLGENHPDLTPTMQIIAESKRVMRDFKGAEDWYLRADKILRRTVGEQHPNLAANQTGLAIVYTEVGKYDEAISRGMNAHAMREKIIGKDNRDYAIGMMNLSNTFMKSGDNEKAKEFSDRALKKMKEPIDLQEGDYAACLNSAATINSQLGSYYEARDQLMECAKIFSESKAIGVNHPTYAIIISNLAKTQRELGEYQSAAKNYMTAMQIIKSRMGTQNRMYAILLNNAAVNYEQMGRYNDAKKLYEEAMSNFADTPNRESYFAILENLAAVERTTGDIDGAERLLLECNSLRKKQYGAEDVRYASGLNSLGLLYAGSNRPQLAAKYYSKAGQIFEKNMPTHVEFAEVLLNQSNLATKEGRFDEAMKLVNRAINIFAERYGKRHPEYANALEQLAAIEEGQGHLQAAEKLRQDALEIASKIEGFDQFRIAVKQFEIGVLKSLQNDIHASLTLISKACDAIEKIISESAIVQSERQQRMMQVKNRRLLDWMISLAIQNETIGRKQIINTMLRWKGAVTNRQAVYRRLSNDPRLKAVFQEYRNISFRLSLLSRRQPRFNSGKELSEAQKTRVKRWSDQFEKLTLERERLEKTISNNSRAFASSDSAPNIDDLLQGLPVKTAYIDFLEFIFTKPNYPSKGQISYEKHYCALVLQHDFDFSLVDLGPAAKINQLINDHNEHILNPTNFQSDSASKALNEALWLPIARQLSSEINSLLICPDTYLGHLSFASLKNHEKNRYLIEDYRISQIPNWRSLVEQKRNQHLAKDRNDGVLIVGNVDYDKSRDPASNEQSPRQSAEEVRTWNSLTGFSEELGAIKSIFERSARKGKLEELTRQNATESVFLERAKNFGIVHMITHGFFEKRRFESLESPRPDKRINDIPGTTEFVDRFIPGILSGLVLAGANQITQDSGAKMVMDDGLLLATEIESSSLQNTELVVLSACETGLGSVAGGEGLIGLQRAFHVSGARSVIASLWKVDDRATQELMTQFYTNLWIKKQSKIDALRNAQLWMLDHASELEELGVKGVVNRGDIRVQRKPTIPGKLESDRTPPWFWAAFQLSGDWN